MLNLKFSCIFNSYMIESDMQLQYYSFLSCVLDISCVSKIYKFTDQILTWYHSNIRLVPKLKMLQNSTSSEIVYGNVEELESRRSNKILVNEKELRFNHKPWTVLQRLSQCLVQTCGMHSLHPQKNTSLTFRESKNTKALFGRTLTPSKRAPFSHVELKPF